MEQTYGLKIETKLLHNEQEKVKPYAREKDKINMLKLKVKFQETENNSFKNEINYKQALIDSILKPNSDLDNYIVILSNINRLTDEILELVVITDRC